MYLQLLYFDHCRFILVAYVLTPGLRLTHLKSALLPTSVLPSPVDLPIAVRKGTHSSRNPHPIYNFLTNHRLSSPNSAFISTLSSVSLPKTVHEALSHPSLKQTMLEEMATLLNCWNYGSLLEWWLYYWNSGYTIEKVAHYWNGGYTIEKVAHY